MRLWLDIIMMVAYKSAYVIAATSNIMSHICI